MKVFASLATILGVAYAAPNAQQMHHLGQTSSMRSSLQQHNVMHPSADNVMPSMQMSTIHQAQTDPNQYHLQDNFGNYEYAFKNKDSEKMEKGNDKSVRGRYAYIMSDGLLRRVEYIADNNGFHILEDNADNSKAQDRNKRSVEPDLIQTRMTSFMDSSSPRDNSLVNPNMYTSHIVGKDMLSDMMERNWMNDMSSNHNMYVMTDMSSNLMGRNMMGNDMMDRKMIYKKSMGHMMNNNMMDRNMMGREKINHNVMGQDMSSKIMSQNMYSSMMDHDMSSNMMNRNMMVQDMPKRNVMVQDMSSNMMGQDSSSKIMGRNMYSNMMARDMSSNMIIRNMMGQDMNRLPLGQQNTMSQRMEIKQVPQSIASKWFF